MNASQVLMASARRCHIDCFYTLTDCHGHTHRHRLFRAQRLSKGCAPPPKRRRVSPQGRRVGVERTQRSTASPLASISTTSSGLATFCTLTASTASSCASHAAVLANKKITHSAGEDDEHIAAEHTLNGLSYTEMLLFVSTALHKHGLLVFLSADLAPTDAPLPGSRGPLVQRPPPNITSQDVVDEPRGHPLLQGLKRCGRRAAVGAVCGRMGL